jgi:hypothetical protein
LGANSQSYWSSYQFGVALDFCQICLLDHKLRIPKSHIVYSDTQEKCLAASFFIVSMNL